MNIKTKIFIPSLSSAVMMLILGVVSFFGMRTLQQALDDVTTRGMGHIQAITNARSELLEANLTAYRLFSTMANMDPARIKKETDGALGHADAAIKALQDLSERSDIQAEEKQDLTKLAEPLAKYRKTVAQAIDMADSDLASGTGMMQAADKRFLQINSEFSKIIEGQQQKADALIVAAVASGNRTVMTGILVFLLGLVGAATISFILAGKIVRPLLDAIRTAKSVAGGNLSDMIDTRGQDETGDLLRALADMQKELRDLIGQIGTNARMTAASCGSMSAALQNINHSVQGQNDATSAVAAAVEEMSVSISNIHENASQALDANRESAGLASQGVNVIQSASSEMLKISATVKDAADVIEQVGQQTNEISSIVSTIREVADQTNLLALNAAIEAARAGEQGRGFAVVADEVRKLAEKTTSSAEEIRRMIEAVQQSSGHAVSNIRQVVNQMEITVSYATDAREAIESIQRSSKRSEGYAQDISAALGEQSSASHLIAQQVEGITRMSDANAHSVTSAGQSMRELEHQSHTLDAAVAHFKL